MLIVTGGADFFGSLRLLWGLNEAGRDAHFWLVEQPRASGDKMENLRHCAPRDRRLERGSDVGLWAGVTGGARDGGW